MKSHPQPKSVLQSIISAHLNVEAYAFDELAQWCRAAGDRSPRSREFKKQLHSVVKRPGQITPETYERWTCDDKLETQEAVDKRFKDLWNACFPAEAIA